MHSLGPSPRLLSRWDGQQATLPGQIKGRHDLTLWHAKLAGANSSVPNARTRRKHSEVGQNAGKKILVGGSLIIEDTVPTPDRTRANPNDRRGPPGYSIVTANGTGRLVP
jgi:hypothetical protein